jgi:hypothetical protein
LIQARYGWTDQIIIDLSAARLLQIIDIVLEAYEEEARQKYTLQAYNAWQIIEVIKGVLSEKAQGTSFADYLKKIGLKDKSEKEKMPIEAQAKAALSIADGIRQLDKQGRD